MSNTPVGKPKSVFIIQCVATSIPGGKGEGEVKYFALDSTSGGYPWFPENWYRAQPFKTLEEAMDVINHTKTEKPTAYNGTRGDAFRQFAIPHTLRGIVGGRIDNDGFYSFTLTVVEVCGDSLAESTITKRHELVINTTQHHNIPNSPPHTLAYSKDFDEQGNEVKAPAEVPNEN